MAGLYQYRGISGHHRCRNRPAQCGVRSKVNTRVRTAILILLTATLLILLSAYFFSRRLQHNLSLFQHAFNDAVENGIHLNKDSIFFTEFKQLAGSVNRMIDRLNRQTGILRHTAQHDALTDLPNRLTGNDHLETMLQTVAEHNASLALFFIDLDNFKEVNDTLGHSAGDQLLRQVRCACWKPCVRKTIWPA